MSTAQAILRVEGLGKRFGRFSALRDLSFAVAPGETLGLLGRNGAGKSTAIRILCNLLRPSAGQAWLRGEAILGTRGVAHRRLIGAVVEAPRFYPQLSGRRNLALVARLLGVEDGRVDAMLERVDLAARAHVPFGQFSMGMKQRLGLAAAFLHRPPLVILDEPTTGLDPVGQRQIRDLIRALTHDAGVSALLCSHLLDEVGELCDRALVIEQGALILEQPLAGGGIAAVEACFRKLAHARDGAARDGAAWDGAARNGAAQEAAHEPAAAEPPPPQERP
jgi:ABC-2 type transport system ATP-binding protein